MAASSVADCVKWAFCIAELNQIDDHIVAPGVTSPANIESFSPKAWYSIISWWNWCWHQLHWQAQSFPSSTHSTQHIIPSYRPSPLHLCLCDRQEHVLRLCQRQNTRKAPRPDGISRFCLKACGDQLAPVFTQILSRSLSLCLDLTYYKYWTMLLILWRFHDRDDNYRTASFTPVISVLLLQKKTSGGPLLDPLLLASRALTLVNEAVIMHSLLQHLSQRVIALYATFSAQLTDSIPLPPISLKDRMQQAKLWKFIFCSGIPQGCVFASLLFFFQHKWLYLWRHQSFLRLPTPPPSPHSTLWPQWKFSRLRLNYV